MMTITEFLLARIAEDEAVARYEVVHMKADDPNRPTYHDGSMIGQYGQVKMSKDEYADFLRATFPTTIETPDPRLWAECAAKRAIVEKYAWADGYPCATEALADRCHDDGETHNAAMDAWETLRILAAVYAGHPDYDEAWRP